MTTTETGTVTPTASLEVLNGEVLNIRCSKWRRHLATWCNQWVMEIAKPIMEHTQELYGDPAVRLLIERWYEADTKYRNQRRTYLVHWSELSEMEPEDRFEPLASYKWANEERQALNDALRALLIK